MAQLAETTLHVNVDLAGARRRIKRVLADTQEANRELARLQERLDALQTKLAEFGIRLEVD